MASLALDSALDAPPPSPAQPGLGALAGADPMMGGGPGGMGGPPNVPGNVPPALPVIQGILDGGTQIALMLDSFAQATPQFAPQLDQVKQALQVYLGQLVSAGAGPTGPTAVGQPFPGGGFGRGPVPS
jgi:hypothetical protein